MAGCDLYQDVTKQEDVSRHNGSAVRSGKAPEEAAIWWDKDQKKLALPRAEEETGEKP